MGDEREGNAGKSPALGIHSAREDVLSGFLGQVTAEFYSYPHLFIAEMSNGFYYFLMFLVKIFY